ncbi:hypothetical protein, partial [Flavonifractor plautii]|uniref:hypothetical protein n=1 Tax=Flavonifractor plautii TaxID=292800 RepID=UPI001A9A5924
SDQIYGHITTLMFLVFHCVLDFGYTLTFKAGSKIIGHCILVKLLPGKSPAGGAKPDNIEY